MKCMCVYTLRMHVYLWCSCVHACIVCACVCALACMSVCMHMTPFPFPGSIYFIFDHRFALLVFRVPCITSVTTRKLGRYEAIPHAPIHCSALSWPDDPGVHSQVLPGMPVWILGELFPLIDNAGRGEVEKRTDCRSIFNTEKEGFTNRWDLGSAEKQSVLQLDLESWHLLRVYTEQANSAAVGDGFFCLAKRSNQ